MRRSAVSSGEIILLSNTSSRPASVSGAETNLLQGSPPGSPFTVCDELSCARSLRNHRVGVFRDSAGAGQLQQPLCRSCEPDTNGSTARDVDAGRWLMRGPGACLVSCICPSTLKGWYKVIVKTGDRPRLLVDSVVLGIIGGLAVMLSFVIQINLSSFFKYSSLYEAQVGGRSDSPAHIAEHVQIALRLLEQGKIVLPPPITHLHLAALLQSGVALDLPDGSQLVIGALRPESPWVGKQLQSRTLTGSIVDSKVAAILRGKTVLRARPETVLQPGDRLLMIASQQAQAELLEHLVPPSVSAGPTNTVGVS
jgi:TrkA-C domain